MMITLYYIVFIFLFLIVEIKHENKLNIYTRTYFNYLDTMKGKGTFMCFIALILSEKSELGMVFISIPCYIIGFFNICLGFADE
jgi:hypothetical protein